MSARSIAVIAKMLDGMFEEIATKVPGFSARDHQESILISSPDAQVYYHFDLPGQALIADRRPQAGLCYPNTAPFLTPKMLEDVAVFNVEVDIPYEPWYDKYAKVFDIGPGQCSTGNSTRRTAWRISTHSAFRDGLLHQRSDQAHRDR